MEEYEKSSRLIPDWKVEIAKQRLVEGSIITKNDTAHYPTIYKKKTTKIR
jgi:hypothetical protein